MSLMDAVDHGAVVGLVVLSCGGHHLEHYQNSEFCFVETEGRQKMVHRAFPVIELRLKPNPDAEPLYPVPPPPAHCTSPPTNGVISSIEININKTTDR